MKNIFIFLFVVFPYTDFSCHAQGMIRIPERHLEFETIQKAIDASRSGEHVIIPEGTYTHDCTINIFKDSVTILGEEKVEVVCTSKEHNVFWLTGDHIIISNIRARHVLPEDFAHCTGNVFAVDNCDHCVIEKCDINGCGRIGVYMFDSHDLLLSRNRIHKNSLCAVDADGTILNKATDELSEKVRFEKNRIWDNGPDRKEKRELRKFSRMMSK